MSLRGRTIGETGWVAGGQNHWSCMSWFACVSRRNIDRLVVCRWYLCSAHPQVNSTPPSGRMPPLFVLRVRRSDSALATAKKIYTAFNSNYNARSRLLNLLYSRFHSLRPMRITASVVGLCSLRYLNASLRSLHCRPPISSLVSQLLAVHHIWTELLTRPTIILTTKTLS